MLSLKALISNYARQTTTLTASLVMSLVALSHCAQGADSYADLFSLLPLVGGQSNSAPIETGGNLPLPDGGSGDFSMTVQDQRAPAAFKFKTIRTVQLAFRVERNGGGEPGRLVQVRENDSSGKIAFQGLTDADGNIDGNFTTASAMPSVRLTFEDGGKLYHQVIDTQDLTKIQRTATMVTTAASSTTLPDGDGDGVPDVADDFPADATRATAVHYPSSGVYTIAFEDLYPSRGDADFNDFVVQFRQTEELNAAGDVVRITGSYRHVARAAGYKHRLRLNLPLQNAEFTRKRYGPDGSLKSEEQRTVANFAGVEITARSNTTIPQSNAHRGQTYRPGDLFQIEIKPTAPTPRIALGEPPYDLYLDVLNTGREVHFAGRVDNGGTDPYLDDQGFPWALLLPVDWRWMYERENIHQAYPEFDQWYQSGGLNAKDWYLRPRVEKVFPAATSAIAGRPAFTPPAGYAPNGFTVEPSLVQAPYRINDFAPVSAVWDISPAGGGGITFPADPARIEFTYNKSALQDAGLTEEFAAYYFDSASGTWKLVDRIEVDFDNSRVIAYTSHLTPFVLTALPVPTGAQQPAPPACIASDFPAGPGGSGTAVFSTIDLSFRYYQDRNYFIRPTSTSPNNAAVFAAFGFEGALGISTCNGGSPCGPQANHKLFAGNSYISFTAHTDMDVYVMYDDRGVGNEADWLRDGSWTATGQTIETTDPGADYLIYRKTFTSGSLVELHGNRRGASPAVQTNYWAIVKPAGDLTPSGAAGLCVAAPDTSAPGPVTNLQAAPGATSVTLTWQNPADTDFAGVVIRRSTSLPAPAKINEGTATTGTVLGPQSFRDDNAALGTTYYYSVFALDENNLHQAPAPTISVTTSADSDGDGLSDIFENSTDYSVLFPGSPAPNFSCATLPCASGNAGDTDGDGVGDGIEFAQGTDPTNPDGNIPVVTAFTRTSPSPGTNNIVTFTTSATDDVAVTGWLVTQTSTQPTAVDPGWSPVQPSSYALPGSGTYQLYIWTRDAAGNVSNAFAPINVVLAIPSPGTGVPVYSDISVGEGPNSVVNPVSVFDPINNKLLVVSRNFSRNNRIGIFRCDPDGSNCTYRDIYWPWTVYSGFRPSAVIDTVNQKILIAFHDGGIDYKSSMFRCGLDLVLCEYHAIGYALPAFSGGAPSIVIDPINSRVLVVTVNSANNNKPQLIHCDLNDPRPVNCVYADISAGQGNYSGDFPTALVDTVNQKLLVVTRNQNHPSLFRCDLDGSNCTHADLSAGIPSPAADVDAVIDTVNSKLLVTTHNAISNNGRPSLFRCELDGSGCVHRDISAGRGPGSGRFPDMTIDYGNNKLLVVTEDTSVHYQGHASLFRCDLDGTNCAYSGISDVAGRGGGSGRTPSIVIDPVNGLLLTVTKDSTVINRPSLFRN